MNSMPTLCDECARRHLNKRGRLWYSLSGLVLCRCSVCHITKWCRTVVDVELSFKRKGKQPQRVTP